MLNQYISLYKRHTRLILTLGFTYAATIVFTFWGPLLSIFGGTYVKTLSVFAVSSHIVAFFLAPAYKKCNMKTIYFIVLLCSVLVLSFNKLNFILKLFTVILYAFIIGRIGNAWCLSANKHVAVKDRGKLISSSLFMSFIILYFVNMISYSFKSPLLLIIPVLLCIISVYLIRDIVVNQNYKIDNALNKTGSKNKTNNILLFAFLIVIYISGGFSYAGIYPSFNQFAHIDRYYNVLTYIFSILICGYMLDNYGRKTSFTLGASFLGVSFTFFLLPKSVLNYFITQTFLQAGWAFVNSFGWSFSWDLSTYNKRGIMFPRGISSMLFGASLGAILVEVISNKTNLLVVYGVITFIPLFISILMLNFLPETLSLKNKVTNSTIMSLKHKNKLTNREVEICELLIKHMTYQQIAEKLFISQNTVKTHIQNLYSKLNINSKRELQDILEKIL